MYNTREPSVLDYASPVQFRFKCSKLPTVEFFCQTANIPGMVQLVLHQCQQALKAYTNTW